MIYILYELSIQKLKTLLTPTPIPAFHVEAEDFIA